MKSSKSGEKVPGGREGAGSITTCNTTEPVFLNVYGAQESIPRHEFRLPM
jgi:hypothetical protein